MKAHLRTIAPCLLLLLSCAFTAQAAPKATDFERGNALAKAGDFDGAIAALTAWLRKNPKDATAYLTRGSVKYAKGDLKGALGDYDRTIALRPKGASAYHSRGLTRHRLSDLKGALADYDRAIALDPKYAHSFNNRGRARDATGNLDGALADFDRAIALDPKFPNIYYSRGAARHRKGDLDGALADFDREIALSPKDAAAHLARGFSKRDKGDHEGALADFDRALALDPKHKVAYYKRGEVNFMMRRWNEALMDFRKDCELGFPFQEHPRLFIWLIRARLGEGEPANEELASFLGQRGLGTPGDWLARVGNFLLGKWSEEQFFALAAAPDEKIARRQECAAWFYAGMKRLLAGEKEVAADYFDKCLATEQKLLHTEYRFAEAERKALGVR